MATNRYCDGIRRRDFLRVGVLGAAGLSLAGYLRLAEAGEVDAGGQGDLGDLRQPGRRPVAHGHVRPEAERAQGIPRRVQPDRDQRPGRRDLRAPAQAGAVRRQVRDPPRRQPQPGRARVRHQVHEHGQPADPVAGVPRLRRGRDARSCRARATCRRSWRSRTRRRWPATWASSSPRSAPTNTPRAGQPFTVRGITLGRRPDGRGDREAPAPARTTSTRLSAASRSRATWSTASTGSRSGPTTSSARPARARRSTSARNRPRSPSCSTTARSRRAACWRPGWSSRACGS